MIRKLTETADGLGTLELTPETDEERVELERVCPRHMRPGIIHRFAWLENGKCMLVAEVDPNYTPETLTPPSASPRFEPVPSRAKLVEWAHADLLTKAAELGVAIAQGERKAELVLRIIDAWNKRNAELEARARVPA